MPFRSKNIIIVGGSSPITLINPLAYAIALPTLPRMTVSDINDLLSTALIPYDKPFTNATPNARGGVVVLEDGTQMPYDVLVLAPGSIWEGPLNLPWTHDALTEFAQKIVLAGGGAVGIEYAGEIKDVWPGKELTIVHGGSGIMNATYPARFRDGLERKLRARGINVIFNDHVDEIPPPGLTTIRRRKGNVPTKGARPRTAFIAQSLGPPTLDAGGHSRMRPTLQLLEYPHIFAIGDAIDTVEQKQVAKASAHAAVAAANIVTYLSPGGGKLKAYAGAPELIVVTNGRSKNLLLWNTRSFMDYSS
ncbi:FAD/NAD(P)-binding domain-containing protein [Mycena vitilis]|nr:FAD/NAD(P)-binding domain-containing protein [Mycena vitilis]